MKAAIHFISGLPRSGSTLLAALLRQNPRFDASITGPVAPLVEALLRNMSMANETSVFLDDAKRERMVRSIFDSYYDDVPDGHVVFDTNRSWTAKMPLVAALFPKARVICCVRDVPDVYDSLERLVRRNKFQPSGVFGFDTRGTVYSRVERLSGKGMVGTAWANLREAFCGEESDKLLAITYRTLTNNPQRAMDAIYDFIDEPRFQHDFANIRFDPGEFDRRLGMPGLHSIHRETEPHRREHVLPPDIIRRFSLDSFWHDPSRSPNPVKVI